MRSHLTDTLKHRIKRVKFFQVANIATNDLKLIQTKISFVTVAPFVWHIETITETGTSSKTSEIVARGPQRVRCQQAERRKMRIATTTCSEEPIQRCKTLEHEAPT